MPRKRTKEEVDTSLSQLLSETNTDSAIEAIKARMQVSRERANISNSSQKNKSKRRKPRGFKKKY